MNRRRFGLQKSVSPAPAGRLAANPPLLLPIDGTDGWTDGRKLDRFIDLAPHTMLAMSKDVNLN